jgi:hypothetical protein
MPASFSVAPATEAPPQGMELEPPGAGAGGDEIRVTLDRAHARGCKPEVIGDDLRVGGGVTLPGRLGADQNGHAAVIIKADARGVRTIVPARLDIGGNSDAAQPPGFARLRQPPLETVPVGALLCSPQVAAGLAGIVGLAGWRRVRHRRDEIPPPQLVGRDADLARGKIHQALDHVGRLGPPGAAIGVDRYGVGERAAHADMAERNVVEARRHAGADKRNERRIERKIGAHVSDEIDVESEKAALRVERELRPGEVVAALRITEKVLAAVRNPLHRPPEASRGKGGSAYSR